MLEEPALEALNGGDVEMVGRFVQQQHVGVTREGASKRGATRFAAGKVHGAAFGIEAKRLERGVGLMREYARPVLGGADVIAQCGESREVRLLRSKCDGGPGR
jgi:hypothetical protein